MKYLLMIVLLLSFSQARADKITGFVSGNALLEFCETFLDGGTSANIAKGKQCSSYIVGVVDIHSAFVGWKDLERYWCFPSNNMGKSQLVRVVTKYLQEHPEDLHFLASGLVANALILAFPCE